MFNYINDILIQLNICIDFNNIMLPPYQITSQHYILKIHLMAERGDGCMGCAGDGDG